MTTVGFSTRNQVHLGLGSNTLRFDQRPLYGDVHYGAWHSILFRQLPQRKGHGKIQHRLRAAIWLVPGNPTFSRLAKQTRVPHGGVESW